jgi:hypothetical protein
MPAGLTEGNRAVAVSNLQFFSFNPSLNRIATKQFHIFSRILEKSKIRKKRILFFGTSLWNSILFCIYHTFFNYAISFNLKLNVMKEFKKHIHGISAALLFVFISVAVLILTGFSTPLPLPEEEAVIIDFSNSNKIDIDKSDLSVANNSSEGSNSESSREILSENSDNIYVPSGNSKDDNSDKIDKINNLFGNPFGEFGDSENDGDNPFGENGNNKQPGEISGKICPQQEIIW